MLPAVSSNLRAKNSMTHASRQLSFPFPSSFLFSFLRWSGTQCFTNKCSACPLLVSYTSACVLLSSVHLGVYLIQLMGNSMDIEDSQWEFSILLERSQSLNLVNRYRMIILALENLTKQTP